jgi:hypothetical protein
MNRNILLVEPDFKTKFPPLGLMKISTYHKRLGDNVHFTKGIDENIQYTFWDRIYVSTLFTYHWKKTVETINFYKWLVRGDLSRIMVGGILATLMPKELWNETGIVPKTGLLRLGRELGDDNEYDIDHMIPDYELFNNSTHKYNLLDSYFGYSTRGCIRKCKFCGVHLLEPKFVDYIGIKPYVNEIKEKYGVKQHLVLFDNNILASKKLNKLINDLCELGFEKGSILNNKKRHVDFNQGVDSRFLNEAKFKLLSRIEIKPLRIAFDHIKYEKQYSKNIRLAAKYDIRSLSNYILYNHNDTPEELWKRLKINIDLNKECDLQIYSFPMKYIPLNAKDRTFIGKHWNWQFIRGVQRILNVMKGAVMPKEDFFYRAFGQTEEEFLMILHMPEYLLMNRGRIPRHDEIDWSTKFSKLTMNEKNELLTILCENRTKSKLYNIIYKNKCLKIKKLLKYYVREDTVAPVLEETDEKEQLILWDKR